MSTIPCRAGNSARWQPRPHSSRPQTLTTPIPALRLRRQGAKIWLTYAEALFDKQMHKVTATRSATAGTRTQRQLSSDGGANRVFEPLWWRTWRYLDLDIETADEPLTLNSLTARFTAYPFEERASFQSPTPSSTTSGRSAGAPPASMPTKPTWTRPTMSSCNTWATPHPGAHLLRRRRDDRLAARPSRLRRFALP